MQKNSLLAQYKEHYVKLGFERAELFRFIKQEYGCSNVLYPGCSIHITPSFYFPHVVYIDKSEDAKSFFSFHDEIGNYIDFRKNYTQSSYFEFIFQDFAKELPVREGGFDLLISLWAGCISRSCKKYLKKGGIILTNNHQDDAVEAVGDNDFELLAVITRRKKKYNVIGNPHDYFAEKNKNVYKRLCKGDSRGGIKYTDNEDYFVFRKLRDPGTTSLRGNW